MEEITKYLIQDTVNERGIARVWEETVLLPTYEIGVEEKNPVFCEKRVYQGSSGVVYPYPVVEKISDEKKNKPYKALFLENEYLKIMLLPELGGRVQMAWDKVRRRHFVYYNQVIKPALVGLTGPWISGGIEFNWPQHHRPDTFLPTDYCMKQNDDGSVSLMCNDIERMSRLKETHCFTLHPGKAYLEIEVKVLNRTPFPQTFLWWANPAVSVNDFYHSVFPPDVNAVFDHGRRDVSTFPIATGTYYKQDYSAGVDISRYKNIPVPTSYMAVSSKYDFVGGYEEDTQGGLLHVADHHISPGKKQWTWGCGDFGRAWDRNLTDEDGPYIELMTGVFTDNQPDFSWLQAGEERRWKQYFMPYSEAGYVKNANKDAIINYETDEENYTARVIIYTTGNYKNLRLLVADAVTNRILAENRIDVSPEKPCRKDFEGKEFIVPVKISVFEDSGALLIEYLSEPPEIKPIPNPARAIASPKDIKSVEMLYLSGLHLEQYRHATYNPTDYYAEALLREEGDIRCNNAMGLWLLRRGQFEKSEKYFRRSIKTLTAYNPNPYDGEAYYNLGLCLKYQGKIDDAYDAFFKSAWNIAQQRAAFLEISRIDCKKGNWAAALEHIENALAENSGDYRATGLKSVILRKISREDEALQCIDDALKTDPFNVLCRFEKYFLTGEKQELTEISRISRLSVHDYMEYSLDYAAAGLYAEAASTLNIYLDLTELKPGNYPDYPMLYYALGYFSAQEGDADKALKYYAQASQCKPDYCFPNRIEEVLILKDAAEKNPSDARALYFLGNFWYSARQYDEAIECWERSAAIDDAFPTVLRNLALALYNKKGEKLKAQILMEQAFELDKSDSRLFMELDQLYRKIGKSHIERLNLLEKELHLTENRDDMALERITLLNQLGEYEKAKSLLASRKFHPWEGGEGKVTKQFVICNRELARKALKNNKLDEALSLLDEVDVYPQNLGEGKLINAEENAIDYYKGLTYRLLNDNEKSRFYFLRATVGEKEPQQAFFYNDRQPDGIYYQGLAWRELGEENKARSCFNRLIAHGEKHIFDKCAIDYFAVSLPDLAIWEDDLDLRNRIHCNYVIALGNLGLNNAEKAKERLKNVLNLDINHQEAEILLKNL